MKATAILVQAVAVLVLSGCASALTGITGGDFACKAPDGVQCQSVAGNYANAVHNNLPAQRRSPSARSTDAEAGLPAGIRFANARQTPATQARVDRTSYTMERIDPPSAGGPMRSSPKVLRIWSAPWEDADGSFHDQSYSYITVDPGRWLVENALYRIRDQYAPPQPMPAEMPKPAKPVDTNKPDAAPASPITSMRALRVKPLQEESEAQQLDAPGSRPVIIRPLSKDAGKAGG